MEHDAAHVRYEIACRAWMPTNPPRPAPLLLTEDETVIMLRLDGKSMKSGRNTLRYYTRTGLLRGIKIGRRTRFRIEDIERFLKGRK